MPAKHIARISDEGVILQIFNEGIDKKAIFPTQEDRKVFISYLKEYLTKESEAPNTIKEFTVNGKTYKGKPHLPKNYYGKVELICYSIHPTHFNLILKQSAAGSIERFVRSLCTRYSMFFNKKYNRSGTLFKGPYKSMQIDNIVDLYLLSRHLHKKKDNSDTSLPEYLGERYSNWIYTKGILDGVANNTSEAQRIYLNDIHKEFSASEVNRLSELNLSSHLSTENTTKVNNAGHAVNTNTFSVETTNKQHQVKTKKVALPIFHRTPELLLVTVLFMFLFTIAIQNIRSNDFQTQNNQVTEIAILDENSEQIALEASPTPSERELLTDLTDTESFIESNNVLGDTDETASASADTETSLAYYDSTSQNYYTPKVSKSVTLLGDMNTPLIYIYKYPSSDSEIIGMAVAGDRYGYISTIGEWQEIKFNITTIGFVETKYTQLEEVIID